MKKKDTFKLKKRRTSFRYRKVVSYSEALFWGEEARGNGVMLIELQKHVF